MVVNTRPGAPSRSGLSTLVPKQYLHEMQRKSARRSPTPATQKGKPCGAAPQIKPQRSICVYGGASQNAVTQRQAQNAADSKQALLQSHTLPGKPSSGVQQCSAHTHPARSAASAAELTFVRSTGPSSPGCGSQTCGQMSHRAR